MRTVTLRLPVLGFVIATRAALGAGLALLFGSRLSPRQRRALGLTLIGVGAATTIPAAWSLSRGIQQSRERAATAVDPQLVGARRYPRKGDDPF